MSRPARARRGVLHAVAAFSIATLGLGDTIAFNPSRGSYGELVCDPRLICPPCAPLLDGLRAACVAGHCDVVEASAP